MPNLVATQDEQGRGRASLGEGGPGVPWGRGLAGACLGWGVAWELDH